MSNILVLAEKYLTPDVVGKLAGLLGESSGMTATLLRSALPLLVAGLGSGASSSGIDALVKAVTSGGLPTLEGLSGLLGDSSAASAAAAAGTGVLDSLFGNKADLAARAVAASAGTSAKSAETVLGLSVPFVGAIIGKLLGDAGKPVNRDTVAALLADNKADAIAALPPRLTAALAAIPGLGGLLGAGVRKRRRYTVLFWLLGLIGLLLLAWAVTRPRVDVATCNAEFRAALTGNTINFDTADATIAPDSKELLAQLAKVANDCKAYKIEVSGHTDTVGDEAMNLSLSQRRAEAVRNYLQAQGVPATQLTAVGFGSTRPVVPTADEVANAANRRIEFTVSD